ncbi:MAG: PilT/PilU family type 4a pilus ATPase [Thermodesulfobacteriota bacterium]
MTTPPQKSGSEFQGRKRIGDAFVDNGLISKDQLHKALQRQTQKGGHLGSILIEMGFISIDDLLDFLSRQSGFPAVNLYNVNIGKDMLELIPKEKIQGFQVLPVSTDETTLTLAMINPHDFETVSEIGFLLGKKVKPVIVPAFMMEAVRKVLLADPAEGLSGKLIKKMVDASQQKISKTAPLITMLQYLSKTKANDLLLTAGAPPALKISNEVKRMTLPPLTPADCEEYARDLLSKEEWAVFEEKNDCGIAATYPKLGRFRANVFRQRGSVAIALRNLPETIPSLDDLNLPEWLREFALRPQGLILIGGPAGHGKSTTMCALVDIINNNRRCNILTLEDPVEYLHKHKMSNINQREVGRDTESFGEGLRNVFRQAPDVIVIGEMRDTESMAIAMRAASTGHLVLSTIHANNSTSVIETIINSFEPHRQNLIRMMLADCLLLCLSQRLLPLKDGQGRILALEKLINSHRIRNRIREEKTHHVRSQMQTGSEDYVSLDVSLATLYKKGAVNLEDAVKFAEDDLFFREMATGKK